jgi:hypothetical protein
MGYSENLVNRLQRFNTFQVIYSQFWFTCQTAADAPWNDLLFFKNLSGYFQIDEEVSTACLTAFKRHLDYLTPEMAFLNLLSKKVPIEQKKEIAKTIAAQPQVELPIQPARPVKDPQPDSQLHEFAASPRAHLLFVLLEGEFHYQAENDESNITNWVT